MNTQSVSKNSFPLFSYKSNPKPKVAGNMYPTASATADVGKRGNIYNFHLQIVQNLNRKTSSFLLPIMLNNAATPLDCRHCFLIFRPTDILFFFQYSCHRQRNVIITSSKFPADNFFFFCLVVVTACRLI